MNFGGMCASRVVPPRNGLPAGRGVLEPLASTLRGRQGHEVATVRPDPLAASVGNVGGDCRRASLHSVTGFSHRFPRGPLLRVRRRPRPLEEELRDFTFLYEPPIDGLLDPSGDVWLRLEPSTMV